MAIPLPIGGGSYVSDSLPVSAQRLVNAYVNIPQTDTNSTANIFGTPGLVQLVSVSDLDRGRGNHTMAGFPYHVIGNTLYRLDRAIVSGSPVYSYTDLGTIEGSGPVSMDDNGTQLCIVVPGGKAYIFIEGTGLAEIVDPNFDGPADSVVYAEGYFNFTTTDGKKFFQSPLNDGRGSPSGTAYDPLDFNVAEADPDSIRGQVYFASRLYILGSQTTQAFTNIGRVPSPFSPDQGGVVPVGLYAPFSIVKAKSSFMMIGASQEENAAPAVWRFTGNGYGQISTTAIDVLLSELTDDELEAVEGWTFTKKGQPFVGWNLPDTCIFYNLKTKRWQDWLSFYDDEQNPWRAVDPITAYGEILVTDRRSGIIGKIDFDTFSDYGNKKRILWQGRPFDGGGDSVSVFRIEAVMEAGVGNSNVEDPQIRLSYSVDGGRTFSEEQARSFGKVGRYKDRAIWQRVGSFPRDIVLRLEFSEEAKFAIQKVEADYA